MNSYLRDKDNKVYPVPSDCSFSISNSWNTTNKRSIDCNKTPQDISILQKRGANPTTYSVSFVIYPNDFTDISICDALSEYESVVGKEVSFIHAANQYVGLLITSGSFSLELDGIIGSVKLSVSFDMRDVSMDIPKLKETAIRE